MTHTRIDNRSLVLFQRYIGWMVIFSFWLLSLHPWLKIRLRSVCDFIDLFLQEEKKTFSRSFPRLQTTQAVFQIRDWWVIFYFIHFVMCFVSLLSYSVARSISSFCYFGPPIILIQRVCFISQSTAGLFSLSGATCYGCSPYEKNWQDKVYASLSKIGKKKHIPVVSCKAQSKT